MNFALCCSRRHLALALVSAALLAFQIVLLQLLSLSQWHHFASLVISLALLGFGAAGTLLAMTRKWMLARQQLMLPLSLVACALALIAPLQLADLLFRGFDSYLLFVSFAETLRLLGTALLLMLPFACGALAIGLIFTAETHRIGSYYFANLLGSGIGCLLGLVGLSLLPAHRLPAAVALLALASSALLIGHAPRWLRSMAGVSLVLIILAGITPLSPGLSQYKDLQRALELPGAVILAQRPSASGQVHVVSSPVLRSASGLSLNWTQELPSSPALFVNGNGFGHLPPARDSAARLDASAAALPYALARPKKVLVLDAGTGVAAAHALYRGADEVIAVEPHAELYDVLKEVAADTRLEMFDDVRLRWEKVASRTWLARDRQRYDLIVLPTLGSMGGSAGLFALHEQTLLTREALGTAWQRLNPQGLLVLNLWLDYPVRAPLRLLNTLVEMLEAEGIADPAAHLAAVRGWGTISLCLKRTPLSPEDQQRVRSFSRRWSFDPLLLPDITPQERQHYHRLQDDSLLELLDAALGVGREQLYRDYPFRVRPTSDDRPFFSQFLRWERLDELLALYGQRTLPFLEMGLMVAGLAALLLVVLAASLILLPLTRLASARGNLWATLLYFGALGLGYMWVELALIHRFTSYLGHPVEAAAVVIGVLLLGSGVGSALSGKIGRLLPGRWALLVAALLLGYALLLGPLLQWSLALAISWRIGCAVLLLLPVSFAMGVPFPLGLRKIDKLRSEQVPWAWGINGSLSVSGAALATLVVVEVGFGNLLLMAGGSYLMAAGAACLLRGEQAV